MTLECEFVRDTENGMGEIYDMITYEWSLKVKFSLTSHELSIFIGEPKLCIVWKLL